MLHQYSFLICWFPAITKFKASTPLSKSHTDATVQVTPGEQMHAGGISGSDKREDGMWEIT